MAVETHPTSTQKPPQWSLAVLTALIVYALPLVIFSRIPTQDGPLHIDTAAAMRESLGVHADFFKTFLVTRFSFETNTLGHYLLFACLGLTDSAVAAEKLFQLIYFALFAGGAAYFLSGVRTGGSFYTPLILPLAYGYIFHMGFYNNCLSICGFLWCWGALFRYNARPSFKNLVLLGGSSFLTWLAHPLGIVAFAAGALFWGAIELIFTRTVPFTSRLKQLILPLFVVCAPLISAALFLRGRGLPSTWSFESYGELTSFLVHLSIMNSFKLAGFSEAMAYLFFVLAALFLLGAAAAIRAWRRERAAGPLQMLLLTIFYLAVYYFAPWNAAGSGYINERLLPCACFFLVALLSSTATLSRTLGWSGVFVLASLQYIHWPVYVQEELVERDYLFAVQQIKPEAIVYPLHTASHGWDGTKYASYRTDFSNHLAGFYTAQRSGIYLNNQIARWQEGRQISFLNPIAAALGHLPAALPGAEPEVLDFKPFTKAAGRPVDYVLIYGNFSDPGSLAVLYQSRLESEFECGLVSPRGLVKVCTKR